MGLLVADVLRHAARYTPHRLAATLGDDEVTFGALDDQANRIAHTLAGMGVDHGDRVAWWGDTSLEVLPIFSAGEARRRVRSGERAGSARTRRPRSSGTRGPASWSSTTGTPISSRRSTHRWRHMRTSPTRPPTPVARTSTRAALDERDPHVIFFTSGSTGRSKGVVLSHRASCLRSFPPLAADTDGGTVCMFPLFHMAGWSLALGCWQSRRPIHFVPAPDAETLLHTAERRRATGST